MKHNGKQVMAWGMAVGLSGSIYGGGAFWLKLNAKGKQHVQGNHQDAHAAAQTHASDHKLNDSHHTDTHSQEHAKTPHTASHDEAKTAHGSEHHAKTDAHKNEHINENHNDHGSAHKSEKDHDTHGQVDHGHAQPIKLAQNAKSDHGSSTKHEPTTHEKSSSAETKSKAPSHDEKPHWTYSKKDPSGPSHWAGLSAEYAQCEKGHQQSPIDLRSAVVSSHHPKLTWKYGNGDYGIENNGHTIQTSLISGSNILTIDGEEYTLAQFHFHNPSEHKINGTPSDLELHFVHKNKKGNLAVVGVMINERQGKENSNFKSIWDQMPRNKEANKKDHFAFNASSLLPNKRDFYHYRGSLTTPPCSEGVKWFVLKEPITMSSGQVEMYSSIFGGPTNRPVQPLQAREITTNSGTMPGH